jgi:hypothetical protein
LNIERGFNINFFEKSTWRDLKLRWEEMKAIIIVDKRSKIKTFNNPNYLLHMWRVQQQCISPSRRPRRKRWWKKRKK